MADEAITMVLDDISENVKKLTITWLCASGAATIVATDTDSKISAELFGWWCEFCVVNPGATAPTDNYELVLNDAAGAKIFGGQTDDCDTANSETFFPLLAGSAAATYSAHFGPRLISSPITFDITSNSQNGALGTVEIFFSRNR